MKNEELIGAYFDGVVLDLERILDDYEAYIITIIRNFGSLRAEDEEEISDYCYYEIGRAHV